MISSFLESWELFREAALAGAVAGALLGFLGVYIVLRRMVFLSAALSEAAGLGVSLSFHASLHLGLSGALASPTSGAVAVTALATLLLLADRSGPGARRDGILAFAFLVGAAGTLAVGTRIVQEVQDVQSILFGSAVAVSPGDFHLLVAVAAAVLLLHVWWRRGFLQASFDPEGAAVRGVPVRMLEAVLLASLAVSISVATRILGALPVFAFSVLPALAAVRVCASVPRAMVVATALGAAAGFAGYVAAFLWELPVGASQTLCAAAIVLGAGLLRRARLALRPHPAPAA